MGVQLLGLLLLLLPILRFSISTLLSFCAASLLLVAAKLQASAQLLLLLQQAAKA